MTIFLAVETLYNFTSFVGFLDFYLCVKYVVYIEDFFIEFGRLEVDE